MPRIQPVHVSEATGQTATVLNAVQQKMGTVPNILATMANSPATANAYLGLSEALGKGNLPSRLREQIALTVGEANQCEYCLSAHSAIGKSVGLSEADLVHARQGTAPNARDAAALEFAQLLVNNRGRVTDRQLQHVRDAGFGEGDITEIIANVALNIFTNYFNHVSDPEIDFPRARQLVGT